MERDMNTQYRKVKKKVEVTLLGGIVRTLITGKYVMAFPDKDTEDMYQITYMASPVKVPKEYLTKKIYTDIEYKDICRNQKTKQ